MPESLKVEEGSLTNLLSSVVRSKKAEWPKISIVTPSYNQGQFIEETILSVINQNYPNLEYIIIDGGSTDDTVKIIEKYEKYITYWISETDQGQSHAINKGLQKATGDILAWINSDDYYLPGTFKVVTQFLGKIEKAIVFGNAIHIQEGSVKIYGSNVSKSFYEIDLKIHDTIIQPSSFWNRSALEEIGLLDENMHYVFDWEWFIRAKLSDDIKFIPIDNYLSVYRVTGFNKTITGGEARKREIASVYKKYADESVYIANEYVSKNKNLIDVFIYQTKNLRPYSLRMLLFRILFPKIADFDLKHVQAFLNYNN